MPKATGRQILKRVRKMLKDEKHWTRAAFARNSKGRQVIATGRAAQSFCLLGAIRKVTHDLKLKKYSNVEFAHNEAYEALSESIKNEDISGFNDSSTHPEVLAKLDEVIKELSNVTS